MTGTVTRDVKDELCAKLRPELCGIIDMVEPGSRVLDLGCGEGNLMEVLQVKRRARVQGIEKSDVAIGECISKGLFVYHGDLDEGLADFSDESFDYVILTNALQELHRPDLLITEAARVGKYCIITFPNFGYYPVRLGLLTRGKMPKTRRLPYEWYDTPNIHLTTIQDFRDFCKSHNLDIIKENNIVVTNTGTRRVKHLSNFFAEYGVFLIKRRDNGSNKK